ncbi:DNA-3-methyladenine glycosylase 2 family protein [Pedobacter sp. MC2016-05]|uniref:DNA-3-methyladenine glycosylase family protein n=1 Tax=Pedobacter sp. MC2016-05 TaxID=2994474 RepID=UPI00224580E8|nr:DNA-3-methyladenine glycosylase 2 family protein [Pedobacter sp. MC2016-05]MCX2474876.1 DNA-3-methyladenine glycosylase 2 family protein [Pedobacter sp. MC2016-05]
MFETFNQHNFYELCDYLASKDQELASVLAKYGYPPFWTRPNTFESLVHIILEQQVSLASALAAMQKLKAKIGAVTPANFLKLNDEELKACYFSRQKTVYVRDLAEKIGSGQLDLSQLEKLPDNEIREQLKKVKGIGDWTVHIYLIFILHHTDVFPTGDLAAVNALKSLKKLPKDTNKDELLRVVADWKPFRTIGLMMIWHYYLEERKPANRKKS